MPLALLLLVEHYGLDDGSPKRLDELARRHGISRARVRLLEARAVVQLRREGALVGREPIELAAVVGRVSP